MSPNAATVPDLDHVLIERAADVLRALALDEALKARVAGDATLSLLLQRIANRYVAGNRTEDAVRRVAAILARGHAASAENLGESCRDAEQANAATTVFLELISALDARGQPCSISLDLSHIGSLVDPALGESNAARIAAAAAASGRELMLSMEGSDRTEQILDSYMRLQARNDVRGDLLGITIQARLHRSARDLPRLLAYPGRIRLVKGAYLESDQVAWRRGSAQLREAYLRFAHLLIGARHMCSIATHDVALQQALAPAIRAQREHRAFCEFESLIGLGTAQIDALRQQGFATREYAVYGEEHHLYVLNRIAEDPRRVFQAVIDAASVATGVAIDEAKNS